MYVLALAADLMFASRIRGTAAAVGSEVSTASSGERLLELARQRRPELLLIDLDARGGDSVGLIGRLREEPGLRGVPIVAFGAHVEREALRGARDAGADRVLARSAFVRALPELLGGERAAGGAA